ncbi:MAG: hypothetical protein R2770_15840 [Acidimicrobiales bacterium]
MAGLVESLRPRGALEIVDDAAVLLRRHFNELSILAALAVLPGVLVWLSNGLRSRVEDAGSFDPRVVFFSDDQTIDNGLVVLQLFLDSYGLALLAYGTTQLVVAELLGASITRGALLVGTLKAAPRILVVWLIVHFLELLGLVAAGIGAIIAMVVFVVAIPVLAAEPVAVFGVPRRCLELTKGQRGRVFGVALVSAVLSVLIGLALSFTPTELTGIFLDGRPLVIASVVFQSLAGMVAASITAGAAAHAHIDLRVRSEGLDIDVKLRSMA